MTQIWGLPCLTFQPNAGTTLPVVQKILRSLKHTEDATTEEASSNIYILCDMALAIASAIARNQQSSKAKGKQPAAASCPGNVPLPSSFYRALDMHVSGVTEQLTFALLLQSVCVYLAYAEPRCHCGVFLSSQIGRAMHECTKQSPITCLEA